MPIAAAMFLLAEAAVPPIKGRVFSCGNREPDAAKRESLYHRGPHLSESRRLPSLARARATNIFRLAIVIGFAMAVLLMRVTGLPVPDSVFAGYAGYLTVLVLYQRSLGRAASRHWLDSLQVAVFLLDVAFVTATRFAFGGMWWLGSTIYMLISTAAFLVLPRRRALVVTVYAAIMFSGGIIAQANGIGPSGSIPGVPSLEGNITLAFAVVLFGTVALLSSAFIQVAFVGIVRRDDRRFRLIVKTASEWVITTDESGRITSANDATYLLTGRDERDIVGLRFVELIHEENRTAAEEEIRVTLADGIGRSFEARYRSSDGEVHWLRCNCNRLSDEASPSEVLIVARDITEVNVLTEQLRQAQKMEALGRLAGGIAHDFNNVLTIIKTYSEFLLENLSDRPSERADVEEIARATDKAAFLTKQLLVFSRRQDAELQTIDLNQSVESLEAMLNRLVGDNIEISTQLAKDIWCVRADTGQIDQLLMNLVVNACDAMPDGGSLRIETRNAVIGPAAAAPGGPPEGRFVLLTVSDTGHGMTSETKARIFEPFFTTKDVGKGTGLGLSIVYGIVHQTGGHVEAESHIGEGTAFRVYLPQVDTELEEEIKAVIVPGARRGNETILLVEDDAAVRTVVSRTLRGAGYWVVEASNGMQAIETFDSIAERLDAVVTDMSMPRVGGRELAIEVRRRNPAMPILFMSGYTKEAPDVAGEGSASEILAKPFTSGALLLRIRDLLDATPRARQ